MHHGIFLIIIIYRKTYYGTTRPIFCFEVAYYVNTMVHVFQYGGILMQCYCKIYIQSVVHVHKHWYYSTISNNTILP